MTTYHRGNQMIDPYLLFDKVQLQEGMHIADFGCGRTGHIVFPAAKMIGDKGIIYAVDVQKKVLEVIRKRAKINNLLNIHTVWSDLEKKGHTAIAPNSLDVGFLVNTLFQAKNRVSMLEEANRLLKDKSRLLVVDWHKDDAPFGPKSDQYINFEELKKWGQEKNFTLQEEFEVGKYHYGLVFYQHE